MKNVVLSFVAVTLLPLVMSSTVLAKTSKKKVMSPVEYYKTLLWKQDKLFTTPVGKVTAFHKKPEHCEEETPVDKLSCLKVACKYSGDCHHDHYLEEIAQWCKGIDGQCVNDLCQISGNCHHSHYLEGIIKQCEGINGECVKVACKYSGDCHHDHYLEEIAQWCKGDADGDCIETMCDYSGDCHHDHYLEKIVKSCGN